MSAPTILPTKSSPSFDWEDPFLLRDQLTEEERMVADSARQFFQKELMPGIVQANRHETFVAILCAKWVTWACLA